jgi:hypoxanthine phosphoribosyltransferase
MTDSSVGETAIDTAEIEYVRAQADCLHTPEQVEAALRDMAMAISKRLAQHNPLILSVMIGGLIPTARLLPWFDFPLQVDYVHATRYRNTTSGGELDWVKPPPDMSGRRVLIIDDILDRGYTLQAIVNACGNAGADEILTAVLADKRVDRHDSLQQADFTGVTVPDRYVFGCGMDYKGYLRNLPGIYAVSDA